MEDNLQDTRSYVVGEKSFRARPLEPALYIVATPIGNLGDITLRALEVLAGTDILACEDTRVTRVLLNRFAIARRPMAYHEHNAAEAGPKILEALAAGKSVALVSDAGTPLVSDPGYRLVDEARNAGYKVVPVPGASAVMAALMASGLPTDSFMFCGFLPSKQGQRRNKLETYKAIDTTLIFFESPNRASDSLQDMAAVFGEDRPAALCRELTKAYETFSTATLGALCAQYNGEDRIRGEVVLLVGAPLQHNAPVTEQDIDALLTSLVQEFSPSKAAGEASRITGRPKGELYQRLLQLKAQS